MIYMQYMLTICEVSALNHEVLHNAMEAGAFVVEGFPRRDTHAFLS